MSFKVIKINKAQILTHFVENYLIFTRPIVWNKALFCFIYNLEGRMATTQAPQDTLIATIDLGSNSFHMLVAQEFQGEIRILEKRGTKVQLAAGLDERGKLSIDAQARGLACLREFAQRVQGMPAHNLSVFATNALRAAHNREEFIHAAEPILGYPIEVISGREEARLIYLGVSHTLADDAGKRLVIDIGGGSTEFIIGERFEPLLLESLHMGCVSYTQRFFPQGEINETYFKEAVSAAKQELQKIQKAYKKLGWNSVVGSSGTMRAAVNTVVAQGWHNEMLSAQGLKKLCKKILQFKHVDEVNLPSIKAERQQVFVGGLAIIVAIFESFELDELRYSDGALREGALWDLIGRNAHENVRERAVNALIERFHIDKSQSKQVADTALKLFKQANKVWKLDKVWQNWLIWAAQLHEIGLAISHSSFHKHGAYLLEHSDLLGFSSLGQRILAKLVRTHRRKFPISEFAHFNGQQKNNVIAIARLLRLAVVLNHNRGAHAMPIPKVKIDAEHICLAFPKGWLDKHPLTAKDLVQEAEYQQAAGFTLSYSKKSKRHHEK